MANHGVRFALRRNDEFRTLPLGTPQHPDMQWLRDRAASIEKDELRLTVGPFLGRDDAPKFLGIELGKTQAEKLLYTTTIAAWLSLPAIVAMIKYL